MDFEYSKQQSEAADSIIEWFQFVYKNPDALQKEREFYLAGYAGVGKSSMSKHVVNQIKEMFGIRNVIFASYTGKAVDVLRNKGCQNPMTIHSMMYLPEKDKKTGLTKFVISPFAPISNADLIVLDEISMIDKKMTADLRSFKKPMLIMGDPGQLPPITGSGGFTTGREPDYLLTEIHRQVADSPILKLATMARRGERIHPGVYGDNVLVTDKYNEDVINDYIIKRGTQPICGANKTRHAMNRIFRKRLGFDSTPFPQATEKIICCQNNAEMGLFNGMTGIAFAPTIIEDAKKHQRFCDVFFKSNSESNPLRVSVKSWKAIFEQNYHENIQTPDYKKDTLKFDYSYILTAHKSQGSEWDCVTVLDESYMFRDKAKEWLYTAITRASKRLIIIQK